MEDKLNQANENIKQLGEKYVCMLRDSVGRNCPYKTFSFDVGKKDDECNGECGVCKTDYYNKLYVELLDKYIVK